MLEPTVTQNSALYFAQHKNSQQRAALFRRFKFGQRKERVARKQPMLTELFLWPRLPGEGRN
jgi:hypothetical protein